MEIEQILKDFYHITGFRISIYDAQFNEIHAYPKTISKFCTVIQTNKRNKNRCIKNDQEAFNKAKETGNLVVYRCFHGLYEAVAPIYHYGIISGYFMMGQVCENKELYSEQLYKSVYSITKNDELTTQVVDSVKEVPKSLIESYVSIMSVIAKYITQANILEDNKGKLAILIMKYLKQNYASQITLPILAERFNCSQSTIIKSFKKEYQTTIIKVLNDIRLDKSVEYLLDSRLTIKEITSLCGFTDQNYFSKVFFHKNGVSPSMYRKNTLNK